MILSLQTSTYEVFEKKKSTYVKYRSESPQPSRALRLQIVDFTCPCYTGMALPCSVEVVPESGQSASVSQSRVACAAASVHKFLHPKSCLKSDLISSKLIESSKKNRVKLEECLRQHRAAPVRQVYSLMRNLNVIRMLYEYAISL
jgi:hypothetical protein